MAQVVPTVLVHSSKPRPYDFNTNFLAPSGIPTTANNKYPSPLQTVSSRLFPPHLQTISSTPIKTVSTPTLAHAFAAYSRTMSSPPQQTLWHASLYWTTFLAS